jgi:hypothetical protein
MLSGKLHWLTVGLALLISAGKLHGQIGVPKKPAGMALEKKTPVRPASYMQGAAPEYQMMQPGMTPGGLGAEGGPMHLAMQGPPPMEVAMAQGGYPGPGYPGAGYAGAPGCDAMGCLACRGAGCENCMRGGGDCGYCGGYGCLFCGAGNGCLGSGRLASLLGCLAPYGEGGRGGQRWFDLSVGTIALARTSSVGPFQTGDQDMVTGAFATTTLISTDGPGGVPALYSTDVDANKLRYGLELIGNIQTGAGANVEVRYFGLNKWSDTQTARVNTTPTLFSVFSLYGTDPLGGFDDTDQSFIHGLTLESALHSGEVNYRRRFVPPFAWMQGGWLMGIRYIDLDERLGFNAVGSYNNTYQFNQLRYFNYDTKTRNQLTGFQVGGDWWVNVVPGLMVGVEGKGGVYGNHTEAETLVSSNSIPTANELVQDGRAAYAGEFIASTVYRLTHSWSFRGSYNLMYIDNVALAQENLNTRDLSNAIGGGNFTNARLPFVNNSSDVVYQGFSLAGEWNY